MLSIAAAQLSHVHNSASLRAFLPISSASLPLSEKQIIAAARAFTSLGLIKNPVTPFLILSRSPGMSDVLLTVSLTPLPQLPRKDKLSGPEMEGSTNASAIA